MKHHVPFESNTRELGLGMVQVNGDKIRPGLVKLDQVAVVARLPDDVHVLKAIGNELLAIILIRG